MIAQTYSEQFEIMQTAMRKTATQVDIFRALALKIFIIAVNQPAIKDDEKKSRIEFRVNKRPSSLKMADDFKGLNWDKKMEHEKSAVRCKVEHPFLIVKKQMGYAKVVYRGLAKNMNRFNILFASANLLMCSRAGRTKEFVGCMV